MIYSIRRFRYGYHYGTDFHVKAVCLKGQIRQEMNANANESMKGRFNFVYFLT